MSLSYQVLERLSRLGIRLCRLNIEDLFWLLRRIFLSILGSALAGADVDILSSTPAGAGMANLPALGVTHCRRYGVEVDEVEEKFSGVRGLMICSLHLG